MDREAAPAAADVEHALALLQRELAADQRELGLLGLLERRRAALEVGAAVGHRRVEEQREELVARVVVVADRAAVAAERVPLAGQPQLGCGRPRRPDQPAGAHQREPEPRSAAGTEIAAPRTCRRSAAPCRCHRRRSARARRRGPSPSSLGRAEHVRERLRRVDREGRRVGLGRRDGRCRPRTRSRTDAAAARPRSRGAGVPCGRKAKRGRA